ncbi:hypothetical protein RHMOL_Rhmol01G0044000 [Rhododendron molle]|uniref:Uncharacterized protein n=1 Tax=Rhododendron molle TaxID=49168 RepID=A0ACC0PZG9_RHOML|nr:hypothetical protein RHMOL_Rhmol01G0044000 [Rhododendron molle]
MAAVPITHVLSAAMVEARGFRDAVCLARGVTEEDFVVEGDVKEVVQMLQGLKNASSSLAVNITDAINLARHFHYVSFSFVRRDCNRVAQTIAKYALSMEFSTLWDWNFSDWAYREASLDIFEMQ